MKVRVSEATPVQLNWLAAQAEGLASYVEVVESFQPTSDWAQAGPIIEREGINLDNYGKNPRWSAWTPAPDRESGEAQSYGQTPLIAAMRCYVVSKLGDEVDVPEILCRNTTR